MPRHCSVAGCGRRATERGWCHGHYLRWVRRGDVDPGRPLDRRVNTVCSVADCKRKFGDVQADKPIRDVPGTGYLNHGYLVVPVPVGLRYLADGETATAEHRFVMAQHLGRALSADESVHHKNGDRLDNRIENLELWSRWQPRGQRVADKVDYAMEILRRYAPDQLTGADWVSASLDSVRVLPTGFEPVLPP
jgi:hypothetical protein